MVIQYPDSGRAAGLGTCTFAAPTIERAEVVNKFVVDGSSTTGRSSAAPVMVLPAVSLGILMLIHLVGGTRESR